MSNAERYRFADFTRAHYRDLIRVARRRFACRSFLDADPEPPFVLWRHDLDFSVHAGLKLARIEADEQMTSTYFVHLHSEFYNLFEQEVAARLRAIAALSHEIGLHVDTRYHRIGDVAGLEAVIAREARWLREAFDVDVRVFSFHIPDDFARQCRAMRYGGLVNADADAFKSQLNYCSDSNGYWRFRPLDEVLVDPAVQGLQVLTHPELWSDEPLPPRQRVLGCIEGRAERTREWYDRTLAGAGRENIDWE